MHISKMEKQENIQNSGMQYPTVPSHLEPRNEIRICPQNLHAPPYLHTNMKDNNGRIAGAHTTNFGPERQMAICQYCHAQSMTNTATKVSMSNHYMAAILCALLLWPCVFIPYCATSCKDKNHYCANCGAYLGAYKP